MAADAPADLHVGIVALDTAKHDRTAFRSGADRIDSFLKLTARKQQKGDFTRVRVATRLGEKAVIGYYAVNAHSVEVDDLPFHLIESAPSHGYVPAAYLSMFGVDRSVQGNGLGRVLLVDALKRLEAASRTVGIKAVVLDVLEDGGRAAFAKRQRFCERMGPAALPDTVQGRFGGQVSPSMQRRMIRSVPWTGATKASA